MSWRSVQLNGDICDQDRLIIDRFGDNQVKFVGSDCEFSSLLNLNNDAPRLVLILNKDQWCSEIIHECTEHLTKNVSEFYIGINRYRIKGNDTDCKYKQSNNLGLDVINFLTLTVKRLGFVVTESGHYDQDRGRYFNFVQPLTWVYGVRDETNKSN